MTELNKTHIEKLVTHFYQRVQKDEVLGPIFNDVMQVNWNEHIPLLCQFWNSVMLKTNEYHGNAYQKHILLKQVFPIEELHFNRWLNLFQEEAVNHLPEACAQEVFQKATLIAESLKYGMLSQEKGANHA
ncbi:group III truncated hemoglobin [Fluoribacter dumoffii]|uniref:Group 3 truncated hemoglobin ctb n=1 Tax=Fluoribacter dumoffii TaxID=463 RepID=A0A377GD24_9GAMM|nr:group III truncated hemoglobin [Fluoribacter dumoffii]KTC90729.1 putative globin-like protein [Fluoribacter dumoffii NY 23]MCW8386409.1 group III truncated hemoglobin [Fluoribacter dumoffii]MCW8419462.1 group III truncated hemoglobin [Fluoribacter dumoffii]MCW8452663.1 group III truncated hemoglobin [Fluoribacter dumoffii]MCW8460087.1 group III truncated hemoglobin [Fluoribacter dumoffii]